MRNYQYKQETMQPFKQLAFKFNASARRAHELTPTEAHATAPVKFKGIRIRPWGFELFSCNVPFTNIAAPSLNVPGMYLWWGMCSTAKRHRKMQFGRGWSWKLWRDFFFLHTFRKKRRGQRGRIKRKKKKAGTYWVQSCIRVKQTIEHSSEGWLDRTKPDSIYCLLLWCARNAGAVVILN